LISKANLPLVSSRGILFHWS